MRIELSRPKESQWLVATSHWWLLTISGWVYFFFSLFLVWPIIMLKRRRNACGLGNKVAVSYYLVETHTKKKLPRKHCQHIQVSLLPSSCALFCRLIFFGHFKGGSICIESYWRLYRSCCTLWLISYILGRMILLTFLVSNCHKCWSPIPGGYSLKSSPAVGY